MTFTLHAQGTPANGNNATSLSPALPAGTAEHDLAIVQFQCFGGTNSRTPSIATTGWVEVAVWVNGTSKHGFWYKRLTSAADANPTITLTGTGVAGDTQVSNLIVFRPGSGTFAQVSVQGSTSTNASADSIGAITGITAVAGDLVVMSGGKANDWNGASTAQTGWSKTGSADNESITGNDACTFLHYILNHAGGATGNLTVPDDGGTASNGVGQGIIVSFKESPLKTGADTGTFADKWTQVSVGTLRSLAEFVVTDAKRITGFGASDPEGSDSATFAEAALVDVAPVPGETATLGEATDLDTGTGASKTDTDSAVLGETPALAVDGTDSAALTEGAALRLGGGGEPDPIKDSGTLTEAGSLTVDTIDADAGTQGEGVPDIALSGPADVAVLGEATSLSTSTSGTDIADSEAFSFADKRTQAGILEVANPATGSLTEIAGFVKADSDAAVMAEGSSVLTPIGGDDYRLDDETSDLQILEPGSDATLSEAFTLGAALAFPDSAGLNESATALLTTLFVTAFDTGVLAEVALVTSSGGPIVVVDQTASDSGTLADTGYSAQDVPGADSGTLAETSSVAVGGSSTPSDADAFVFPQEAASLSADAYGAEPWTLAEDGGAPADGYGLETGVWGESGYVEAVQVGSDSIALLELPILDSGQQGIVMGSVSLLPRLGASVGLVPRLTGDISIMGDT